MDELSLWWRHGPSLRRHVRDTLIGEMGRLRPDGWAWPVEALAETGEVHLVLDLGADSLELMQLSSAVAETVGARWLPPGPPDPLLHRPAWGAWCEVLRDAHDRRLLAERTPSPETDLPVRFLSSGSTGAPQRSEHRLGDLQEEMDDMAAALLTLGPVRRLVCPVRCHHIYGFLFSILLPISLARRSGHRPALLEVHGQSGGVVLAGLQPGDVVTGFPDWWRAALRGLGPGERVAPGVVGLSSTAPCPDALSEAALAAGIEHWLQIYGSSETAGIGWRRWPMPYGLFSHWERAGEDSLQRHGRGPRLPIPDHLNWLDPRHFTVEGRRDGLVQVGGVNVNLAQVRRVLEGHPEVALAAVRLTEDPAAPRLKAFIVPRAWPEHATPEDLEGLRGGLMAWVRQHLAPVARPVSLRFGPALPVNEAGKACDWPEAADLRSPAPLRSFRAGS